MGKRIDIWSILSMTDGKPYVQFKISDGPGLQLSPDEARQYAANILEIAAAADADGFLFDFFKNRIGLDGQKAAAALESFRNWREGKNSKTDQLRWKAYEEHKNDAAGHEGTK